jgi:predicted ATPase
MHRKPFITRLHLQNFRSIRDEVIEFDNPLFLVGRNGSGKSNIVDALAFLSECMTMPVQSVYARGFGGASLDYPHRRSPVDWPLFGLRADFAIETETGLLTGHYSLFLTLDASRRARVQQEQCAVADEQRRRTWFERNGGQFETNVAGLAPVLDDGALAFPIIGGLADFAPVYRALSSMRVYDAEPHRMRGPSMLGGETILERDGSNIAVVLHHLQQTSPGITERVSQFLRSIVPGVVSAQAVVMDSRAVELRLQQTEEGGDIVFTAWGMSDGTLRVLAMLVACYQEPPPALIAFEEPETGLHPGAFEAISNFIEDAAERCQIVVTTHSPELLDAKWIEPPNLRIVTWDRGVTHISGITEAPVALMHGHQMGAGELLRANVLDEPPPTPQIVTTGLFDRLAA